MSTTLAGRVKTRREELGLTMRQIPGLDHSNVSRIESGKLKDPGLDALNKLSKALGLTLDELNGAPASAVRMIPLSDIEADPDNPRTMDVGDKVDAEFVASIKEHGVLQAITVRQMPPGHALPRRLIDIGGPLDGTGRPYRVAFGGRRHAALVHIHGRESARLVPCYLTEATGPDLLLKQLIENVRRADMNPMDMTDAIAKVVADGADTQVVATALDKGRRWVQEQVSVGRQLHTDAREALRQGSVSISQAVAIAARKEDAPAQLATLQKVIAQALNEDDIRALTADERRQEEPQQLDLVHSLSNGKPDKNEDEDDADADADAEDRAIEARAPPPVTGWKRWKHARGYVHWRLLQHKDSGLFTTEYAAQWRREGSIIAGWSRLKVKESQIKASAVHGVFLELWSEFDVFATKADKSTLLKALIPWMAKGLKLQGGPADLCQDLVDKLTKRVLEKLDPDALPKPKKTPAPKKPPPLTRKQVEALPSWAAPMKLAYFVIMEGGKATLVKGWAQLAGIMFDLYETEEPETLRAMIERKSWADDTAGKPFDYCGIVYRITDLKARGWSAK